MPGCANIAASLMEHLCTHDWHGYTQGDGRWGDGEGKCYVDVDGATYAVEQGDRDCSSAVIDCWKQAVYYTAYRGALDAATYTGNMRSAFIASGLFEAHPMTGANCDDGYIAQRGDIYLNDTTHTAMCVSDIPDMLAEFSLNENGGIIGGTVGDQTGRESSVSAFYVPSFGWDVCLSYNGKADGEAAPAVRGELRICSHTNAPNQRWRYVYRPGKLGMRGLRNLETGRYIDVPDGRFEAKALLGTYPPTRDDDMPNDAQLFVPGYFVHGGVSVVRFTRDGLSFDVCDGSFAEGARVQLYPTNDGGYPQAFLPVNVGTPDDPEVYIIVNMGTYKVLTDVTPA